MITWNVVEDGESEEILSVSLPEIVLPKLRITEVPAEKFNARWSAGWLVFWIVVSFAAGCYVARLW